MAEIQRKDIISDDALKAPLEFADNWNKVGVALDGVVGKLKGVEGNIAKSGSTVKITEEVKSLNVEQEELVRIQKQIQTVQAKTTDAYAKEVAALNAAKQALKEKTTLGDKEAKSVTAQNSSLKTLEAALAKNREAYKNLTTEQERNSKSGKELLKTIQDQDYNVKALNSSIGVNKDTVGDYEGAIKRAAGSLQQIAPGLTGATKGIYGMVKASLAFLATPIGLVVAALGAAIFALTSYFKGSEEGQNRLNKIMAVGSAIFEQFMNVVEDIGEALYNAFTNPKQALIDFGNLVKQNLINQFVGMLELFPALGKAFGLLFKGEFKAAGKVAADAVAKVVLGVEHATDKVQGFIKKTNELIDEGISNGDRLSNLQAKIDKDERRLITERSKTALEVSKLRQEALDKEYGERRALIIEAIALEEKLSSREVALARTRLAYAELAAKANGEDKDALNAVAQARANVMAAEETAFTNTLRFRKEIERLDNEFEKRWEDINKKQIEEAEKAFAQYYELNKSSILENAQLQQDALDKEIQAIKQAAIDKGHTSEEVDKAIAKKQRDLADDYIKYQIDALQKVSDAYGTSAAEKLAIDKEINKLRLKLTDAYYAQLQDKEKSWSEKANAFIDKYKAAFIETITSISDLSAAFTERRLQDLDLESEAAQERADEATDREKASLKTRLKDETLTTEQKDALKENSAKRQEAIELANEKRQKDIEAQRKKAIRKQAIFDKAVALTIGGIKLAQAILAMLSVGPAGFALSALAAAIGAVQLATIAARPIPAAEHGIDNHKGGAIIAGEAGQELVRTGNKWSLTDSKAALYNLPKGTQIFPHEESMRMIAMSGLTPERENRRIDANADVRKELQAINKTIKSKPAHIIHGRIVGAQVGGTRQRYLNSLRNAG
jgi:hypothetical protein